MSRIPIERVEPITGLLVYANNKESKNQIELTLEISNEGNTPANYKELIVRYWFTKEGSGNMMDEVDYAELGQENLNENNNGSFLMSFLWFHTLQ